jgi:phosphopantothenoylcysteine decarboxylase/phosphopantothenate--cysteine ligase
MSPLQGRRILLIIGGGIAAYKVLELIRRLKERGAAVRAVLTRSAHHFVTPLAVSALSGERVYTELFDLDEEHEIGHIRLSREADLVLVAPATADLLARMAHGLADDLATAVLLATDKPVLAAPAMNPLMWSHPATLRNVALLRADGVGFVGPESGEMAERGEAGLGRLAEPATILAAIEDQFAPAAGALSGLRAIVTSGPTHEPIDPVRFIANRSSGRQGHAIAAALAAAGAEVTLVSGPVAIAPPPRVRTVPVETARQMLDAVEAALPADVAVMAAAVGDWRVENEVGQKIKKQAGRPAPLALVENPDILAGLARHPDRPALLIGFAAETENLLDHAAEKLRLKGCDWIVANDVSPGTGIMGGTANQVHLITGKGVESWPAMPKDDVARALVLRIAEHFAAAQAPISAPVPKQEGIPAIGEPDISVQPPSPARPAAPEPVAEVDRDPLPVAGASLDIRPTR